MLTISREGLETRLYFKICPSLKDGFSWRKILLLKKGWWYYLHPAVCVLSLVLQLVLVTVQLHKMDQLAVWLKTSSFFLFQNVSKLFGFTLGPHSC